MSCRTICIGALFALLTLLIIFAYPVINSYCSVENGSAYQLMKPSNPDIPSQQNKADEEAEQKCQSHIYLKHNPTSCANVINRLTSEKKNYEEASNGKNEKVDWGWKFICDTKITDFLIAFFTMVLAVVTTLLWTSTDKLAKDSNRQIEVAEKSAKAAELSANTAQKSIEMMQMQTRAHVNFSEGDVNHPGGSPPTITLVIKNTGNTPAYNLTWKAKFSLCDYGQPPILDDGIDPSKNVVPSDGTLFYTYTLPNWNNESDDKLRSGVSVIYAIGEIRYKDAYGKDRFTHYRLISGGRFGMLGIAPNKFGSDKEGNDSN